MKSRDVSAGVERSLLRLPARIVFGRRTIDDAPSETALLGRSAIVCTDAALAATPAFSRFLDGLRAAAVETWVYDRTPSEVPISSIHDSLAVAGGARPEVVVGFGGGSSIDMAKATALLSAHGGPLSQYYGEGAIPDGVLPVVAIPTTAGTGSEVTPVAVVSDPSNRLKVGISSLQLVPRSAICDPELTLSCPPHVTAHAGLDALIHAVEAYLAPPRSLDAGGVDVFRGRNAFTAGFALAAIELIGTSLERAVADGSDIESRERMLFGSLNAGMAFGHAGTGGAHALQYPVGAATKTPHGLGVGVLAPFVLEYVRPAAVQQLRDVATALGVDAAGSSADRASSAAIDEIARLAASIGLPRSLCELGVAREEIPGLAKDAFAITRLIRNSPRPLDVDALIEILDAAWAGDRELLRSTRIGGKRS